MAAQSCALKREEMEIGESRVVIEQNPDLVDAESGRCLTGAWIWESALLLAEWLATAARAGDICLLGSRVIELGAGCTGLPGLIAALSGAQEVILTDRPLLIPALQANVLANGLADRVHVQALEWGCVENTLNLKVPFDLLLMSDLLYDIDSVPLLCDTILQLSGPHTLIFLAYEPRLITDECLALFPEHGLLFCDLPRQALPGRWSSEDDPSILRIWHASSLIHHGLHETPNLVA